MCYIRKPVFFYIPTSCQVIDANKQLRWRWDNTDPFGANAVNQNPAGLGAFGYNLRFPGQFYDVETGLHYNYFRDYSPSTGRYIESDPVGLRGGLNTYSYVDGNPVSRIDPEGLATIKIDGNKIQVHKNDVDPWPSDPHGHIYDKNQVVDKNGNIYDKSTGKAVDSLSKKGIGKWLEFLKKLEGKMCLTIMVYDLVKAYCDENPIDSSCLILRPKPICEPPYCN